MAMPFEDEATGALISDEDGAALQVNPCWSRALSTQTYRRGSLEHAAQHKETGGVSEL